MLGKTNTPNYHALQARKGMPSSTDLASPRKGEAVCLCIQPLPGREVSVEASFPGDSRVSLSS